MGRKDWAIERERELENYGGKRNREMRKWETAIRRRLEWERERKRR